MDYRLGASRVDETGLLRCSGMVDLMQDCSGFQLDTEQALNTYLQSMGWVCTWHPDRLILSGCQPMGSR